MVDTNLHIARPTQFSAKFISLSPGTMVEGCWESRSEEELFLTQATFTSKSEEHDGKFLLSVVAIQEWVCRRVEGMENAQSMMLF